MKRILVIILVILLVIIILVSVISTNAPHVPDTTRLYETNTGISSISEDFRKNRKQLLFIREAATPAKGQMRKMQLLRKKFFQKRPRLESLRITARNYHLLESVIDYVLVKNV